MTDAASTLHQPCANPLTAGFVTLTPGREFLGSFGVDGLWMILFFGLLGLWLVRKGKAAAG